MRKLASRVGVEAATLYYHFESRDQILRYVARTAIAQISVPARTDYETWKDWLLDVARNFRAALVKRPYLAMLVADGYVPWDGLPVYTAEREILRAEGVREELHDRIIRIQQLYVVGASMLHSAQVKASHKPSCENDGDEMAADFDMGFRVLMDGLVAS